MYLSLRYTSIFTMRAPSPICPFSSSNTGCIALHGPHQVAKKSTKTGFSDCISSSNFSIIFSFLLLIHFFYKYNISVVVCIVKQFVVSFVHDLLLFILFKWHIWVFFRILSILKHFPSENLSNDSDFFPGCSVGNCCTMVE